MSGRGQGVRLSADEGDSTVQVPLPMPKSERASIDAHLATMPEDRRMPRAAWIRRACREKIDRDSPRG
jgi:hypothetical protein